MGRFCIVAAFQLILMVLAAELTQCKSSTGAQDFVLQAKGECHFINGTERVRFLQRYFYNKEEDVYFDSDVGKFIAKTEFGRPEADSWNSNKDIIEQMKAQVETVCKHNYGVIHSVTADRRVTPKVSISVLKQADGTDSRLHTLYCNVYGFYPSEIEVKWFRNNVEETSSVEYSHVYQNADWTYKFIVMLETRLQRGDLFTCEVLHKSLENPLRVDWKPEASESAHNKKVTGIVGFVLGGVFLVAGLIIYVKSKKAQFVGIPSESFLH
ncbi:SLA class II histocompatibility antigen, DQ haplotype C beta chain [Bombina bombina]|nr:SLA class II histocompatibility antigen, DQ haplotype C beta chain [Bombina bombina]